MASNTAFVDVQADISEPLEVLNELGGNQKKNLRGLLTSVGARTKTAIKKNYSSYLHKNTGTLYKSITRKVTSSGNAVIIEPTARRDGKALYGYALAKGAVIEPRKHLYLSIKEFNVLTKRAEIPSRPFIDEPAMRYLNSTENKINMDKYVQKKIEKMEQKAKQK